MTGPRYHQPGSLDEAVALLSRFGEAAMPVAGGTDVVRGTGPDELATRHLVGLRSLAELRGVTGSPSEGLRIGATVTHREAERAPDVVAYSAALSSAFSVVGTVRIRNQGTVGGNVAQGDPRYDPPAMLLALDATAELAASTGTRTVPLESLLLDGGTGRQHDELLVAIHLPPVTAGLRATYLKFAPRGGAETSTVTVAASAVLSDGVCRSARVFLGAVGRARVRLSAVERALVGTSGAAAGEIDEIAALALTDVAPLARSGRLSTYQQELVRVCTGRALRRLLPGDEGVQ